MNTKQKTVVAFGLVALIAMALYPPWATWCVPMDHETLQYGWFFGQLAYPECAEKLPWTWGLATDRLLLQWASVMVVTTELMFALRERSRDRSEMQGESTI
jgi:hypothetical protein